MGQDERPERRVNICCGHVACTRLVNEAIDAARLTAPVADSLHLSTDVRAPTGRNVLQGRATTRTARQAMDALAGKWERDDNESLNTFGQHLMGGAVLSCAEHLRTAIADLLDEAAAVAQAKASTLAAAADLQCVPDHIKGQAGSPERAAVEAYALWLRDEAARAASAESLK